MSFELNNLNFKRIAIVGVGLIGGSFALALKRKGVGEQIIGIDDQYVLEKAIAREAIDQGFERNQLQEGVANADLIFICTPVHLILDSLPKVIEAAKENSLITDVGSTKREIVKAANSVLANDKFFIGGHPMTGAESSGFDSADPYLFENTIYVLTPSQPLPEELRHDFGELIEIIGLGQPQIERL